MQLDSKECNIEDNLVEMIFMIKHSVVGSDYFQPRVVLSKYYNCVSLTLYKKVSEKHMIWDSKTNLEARKCVYVHMHATSINERILMKKGKSQWKPQSLPNFPK